MTSRIADISPRSAALAAGFGLLIMAVIAIFANFFVLESLVVSGDAVATTANIQDSEGLFRLGIAGFLIIAILDIVVALGLYVLIRPVNASLALLAAWFRVVYAGILGIALLNLVLVAELVSGAGSLPAIAADQTETQAMFFIEAFGYGWLLGLALFGVHLLILGYLILRSGYMPALLGALVMVASLGYLTDSFASVLMPNYADYETLFLVIVAVPGIIGEFSLMFWLLFRGGKVHLRDERDQEAGNDELHQLHPVVAVPD